MMSLQRAFRDTFINIDISCNTDFDAPYFPAPTQSPSYAESQPAAPPGSGSLPLSMDPVLAVVSNSTGHQVRRHLGDNFSQKVS